MLVPFEFEPVKEHPLKPIQSCEFYGPLQVKLNGTTYLHIEYDPGYIRVDYNKSLSDCRGITEQ